MALLVNDEYVDDAAIRQEAGLIRAKLIDSGESDELSIGMQAWEWARENVIATVLLRQAALNETQEALPADATERREEIDLLIERFLAKLTAKVARPTDKEISEHYRRHRDKFFGPEMVHGAHIVKNIDERVSEAEALGAITEISNELRAGRSFEEIADERSDCPGRGGDLGWFPRGAMVEEFDAVIFGLRPGETSAIFKSAFGFHIAKVYERKGEGIRSLNEVRRAIEQGIHRQRSEEAVARFVADLRSRARIEKVASRTSAAVDRGGPNCSALDPSDVNP